MPHSMYDYKDEMRIQGLIKRSKGDYDKMLQLATNMAQSITDTDKALRRANAAKRAYQYEVAGIFQYRYRQLLRGII